MFPTPPRPPFPCPSLPLPIHVPVGAVIAFMGKPTAALVRAGWMICDGTSLTRSMYPELFSAIGYLYSGSGAPVGDLFLLPDLQGYFLRGVDPNSKIDKDRSDRSVGSVQQCALQVHQHDYDQAQAKSAPSDVGLAGVVTVKSTPTTNILPDSVLTSNTETRPANVYVYYLIKFTTGTRPWPAPFDGGSGG